MTGSSYSPLPPAHAAATDPIIAHFGNRRLIGNVISQSEELLLSDRKKYRKSGQTFFSSFALFSSLCVVRRLAAKCPGDRLRLQIPISLKGRKKERAKRPVC